MVSAVVFLEALRMRLADLKEEGGQGLVEYVLIIAFIAIVLIAALVFLQGKISNNYSTVANSLS